MTSKIPGVFLTPRSSSIKSLVEEYPTQALRREEVMNSGCMLTGEKSKNTDLSMTLLSVNLTEPSLTELENLRTCLRLSLTEAVCLETKLLISWPEAARFCQQHMSLNFESLQSRLIQRITGDALKD